MTTCLFKLRFPSTATRHGIQLSGSRGDDQLGQNRSAISRALRHASSTGTCVPRETAPPHSGPSFGHLLHETGGRALLSRPHRSDMAHDNCVCIQRARTVDSHCTISGLSNPPPGRCSWCSSSSHCPKLLWWSEYALHEHRRQISR
jgi:hypothetical protein